ncbi:MAG TPA: hypothetical protein DEA75_07870 [Rhodobacteraceae bacterium]|jgi:hypothetical protein|nr:hypothetical protein [Paracoccaceae bacterium]
MKKLGVQGIIRGKAKKTTAPDKSQPCLKDKVNGKFRAPAPNMLWVSDFTCFSRSQGFVYVTFIIDTFADKIVGGYVSTRQKQILSCMRWSRHCMIESRHIKVALFIILPRWAIFIYSPYRVIGLYRD